MINTVRPMRIPAMRYDRAEGEKAVASRQSVPVAGIAGLQRAARLAGESFGHEDVIGTPLATADLHASRWLWWLAAVAASAGLAVLHFS
ncbi:hypothetical protein [uncultured Bosea sp.]|uniref:hypothetical protein n=1 Tax=uncultured Bosea sp. TaxID=211457 RepID=UPI00263B66FB|nr:hypothetical protein [uncultured Bosea sp.]